MLTNNKNSVIKYKGVWYNKSISQVYCANCKITINAKLYSKEVTNHIKSIKHIKNSVIDTL